jgi:hypothetical protein
MKDCFQRKRATLFLLIAVLLLGVAFGVSCSYEKDEETKTIKSVSSPIDTAKLKNGGPTTYFYLDTVNGKGVTPGSPVALKADGKDITVKGWGVDQKNKKPASAVLFTVDNGADMLANYGEERKDVADHFKESAYANSGFTATVPTSSLTKGKHLLSFKIVSADRSEYFAPEQKLEIDLQ